MSAYAPGSTYVPYDLIPAGIALDSTQYGFPYVASLVLNEKVNKLSITPVVQLFAGARYGTPLATNGFDPTACSIVEGTTPVSCSTDLAGGIPNQVTGKFDNIGAFVEPTVLSGVTPEMRAANLANILNTCFGGSNEPWNVKGACTYTLPNGATEGAIGNTNFGQGPVQPIGQYAYEPAWTQQPFGIYVTGSFKL